MSLQRTVALALARKLMWSAVRGIALGVSLAAVFPTEDVRADCDCNDYGSGEYSCPSGTASLCGAGSQVCDVTCR
jgi:hypothetical protein